VNDSSSDASIAEKEEKVMVGKKRSMFGAAIAAPLFAGAGALAAPMVIVDINISDGTSEQVILIGTPTGSGSTHNFQDVFFNANTFLTFNFNGNAVGNEGAFLGAGWTLENMSAQMLSYSIEMTLMLDSGTGPVTTYEGGGSFGLTGSGGIAGPSGGNPIFSIFADNNLIDSGTIGNITGGQSAGTGQLAGMIGPVSNSLGLLFEFDLTPGSAGQIFTSTGGVGIIPAPAALALMGLAGLAGRRRRRD